MSATTPAAAPAPMAVIYRDEHLVAVHKPAGLLVHRSGLDAHELDTAVERLRHQWEGSPPAFLAPAHRLDKGTSGVLVFALHSDAARQLAAAFESQAMRKRYLALVRGWPEAQTRVDHPLARDPELPSSGQPQLQACTRFTRLARVEWPYASDARHPGSRHAVLLAQPEQGRRHQIRRHLKHIAHPILGDATHGKGPLNRVWAQWVGMSRLWLHAWQLQLPHPDDGHLLTLTAEPGPEWQGLATRGDWQEPLDLSPARLVAG
ncbi:MAG: pseudouridylate synthase [Vitreoscilla sp.]|nr:pseudouridylate synthase [Vitreoscilla sp.]